MVKKRKKAEEYERSIESYFKEIGCYSSLTKDEEYNLWKKYKKNNDISARNKLVTSNLKFVASVARKYQGLGLSYSELIAEGNVGLLKAMDKFDGDKGNKVISYSVWWIRQTILEALNKKNLIKGEDLPSEYDDSEDDENAVMNSSDERYIDQTSDFICRNNDSDVLSILMSPLNEREKRIIAEYYGLMGENEKTLEEIGNEIGLTKERVRQIIEKSLKKIRLESLEKSFSKNIYI